MKLHTLGQIALSLALLCPAGGFAQDEAPPAVQPATPADDAAPADPGDAAPADSGDAAPSDDAAPSSSTQGF